MRGCKTGRINRTARLLPVLEDKREIILLELRCPANVFMSYAQEILTHWTENFGLMRRRDVPRLRTMMSQLDPPRVQTMRFRF